MIEPAVIALRLLQYLGAMVLLGSSLFFLYALPRSRPGVTLAVKWERGALVAAGLLLVLTSLLQIVAQSVMLSSSFADGIKTEALTAVVSYMPQGKAAVVRAAAAAAGVLALLLLPSRGPRLIITAILALVATASLAWMGHAAATEGPWGTVHLVSDMLHVLAAALWLGALAGFIGLPLSRPKTPEARAAFHAALAGFSGIGSAAVAVLILTGVVNSWILVGPDRLESLWTTPYGRLLAVKVLLFLVMLGLAAANRYRLAPALERSLDHRNEPDLEVAALRRSIALESTLGVAVLLLVAWFGTLAPPGAG